jgi:hypothetical protein
VWRSKTPIENKEEVWRSKTPIENREQVWRSKTTDRKKGARVES